MALLALLVVPATPHRVWAQASPHPAVPAGPAGPTTPGGGSAKGEVSGSIQGVPEGRQVAGAKVVLMRYTLTAEGTPEGTQLGTQTVDAGGRYNFKDVPITPRSLYRVLVSLGEEQFGSQGFPLTQAAPRQEVNVAYPHLSSDTSQLRAEEALLAVEPARGRVLVTQVVHFMNNGQDIIDASQKPVELRVPQGAQDLEVVREVEPGKGHERQGERVVLFGNLPPGRTTVALRYHLSAWLGSVGMEARFPFDVGVFSVLTPANTLSVSGPGLSPQASQTIQNTRYDIWAATRVAADTPLPLKVSGIPMRQQVLLIPLAAFVVVMAGVVWWFLRRRLPKDAQA